MLFLAPLPLMGVFFGGMASIGAGEFLRACTVPKGKGFYLLCSLSALAMPTALALWDREMSIMTLSLLMVIALFSITISHYKAPEQSVPVEILMLCFFAGIVFPLFFGSLVSLRLEFGNKAVLLPMITAFSSDIGAYFVGVTLGKHRNITAVSPNKSLEGFWGALLFGTLGVFLYGLYLQQSLTVSLPFMACYGLVGSFMTILGDLSFSLVKRQKGIKDYGNFIVGHGGILDRFDSVSFVAPAVWVMMTLGGGFL